MYMSSYHLPVEKSANSRFQGMNEGFDLLEKISFIDCKNIRQKNIWRIYTSYSISDVYLRQN
jgi:hypothetical protein